MRKTTVLVVGGGVSGLTLSYDLVRLGIDCTVIEKEERWGGLIRTLRHGGLLMDVGPDAFLTQKPQARALCAELGLRSELIPTNPRLRKVFILHDGQLHALPEGMRLTVPTRWLPLLSSSLLTFRGKIRLLLERFQPRRAGIGEESVAQFVERRFGREALERLGEPLLAGIHCGDAGRLSMDRLFPQLVALERKYGSVTRGMLAAGARREGAAFVSLTGGMGRLIEALAAKLPPDRLELGKAVVDVRVEKRRFVATLSSGESVESKALVLALPVRASEKLAREPFPRLAAALEGIETVSSAVVFHAFRRADVAHPLDGYGFVVPETESNRLLAATFVSTKFAGRAPDDTVLLRTFLGGRRDPAALELPDEELIELSRAELAKVLGRLGDPIFGSAQRWPDRTPQVELGHGELLSALDRARSEHPGLFIVGNGLRSVGIPDCVGEARKTAAEVAAVIESEHKV